jgi:hypothetical protein
VAGFWIWRSAPKIFDVPDFGDPATAQAGDVDTGQRHPSPVAENAMLFRCLDLQFHEIQQVRAAGNKACRPGAACWTADSGVSARKY